MNMKTFRNVILLFFLAAVLSCQQEKKSADALNISGVYPHLAYYNSEGKAPRALSIATGLTGIVLEGNTTYPDEGSSYPLQ